MAEPSPFSRFLLDGVGLWAEVRRPPLKAAGPVLLLDRDGILIEDRGYVGRAADVVLLPGVCTAVATCTAAGIPVAIVTNQSGVARGRYDWAGFAEVQAVIDTAVMAAGGAVDAVFACAYFDGADTPFDVPDHPWRKPGAGMLRLALDTLNARRDLSGMVGDKESDMAAAADAGVGYKGLVAPEGQSDVSWLGDVLRLDSPAEAIDAFLQTVLGE